MKALGRSCCSCSEEKSPVVPNPDPKQYWNNWKNDMSLFSAANQERPSKQLLRNCLGKEIGAEVFIPWEMRGNSLSPAIEYNHCFRIACQYIWHKTWFRMISVYFHCLDDRIQDKNIVQSTDVLPARRISVLLKGVCSSLCFFDLK